MAKNHFLIWFAVSVVISMLALADIFPVARSQFSDALFIEHTPPPPRIIIFKIDDASLNTIGQWPWPRETFAEIIGRLQSAAVIGIDVQFREPSRLGNGDDGAFENALAKSTAPVVFPVELKAPGIAAPLLPAFTGHVSGGFSNVITGPGGVVRTVEEVSGDIQSFASAISSLYGNDRAPRNGDPARIFYRGRNNSYPSFPVTSLLDGSVPESLLKDKIVLIGVTASDVRNFYLTPFGFMSGIELQANAIDTFLDDIRYTENPWVNTAAIFFLSLLVVLASVYVRNFFLLFLTLTGIIAAYALAAFVAVDNFFIIDLFYPLIAVVGTALVFSVSQYVTVARREALLRESFGYLDAMVKSMNEGVVMADTKGNIVVVNPAAEALVGTPKEALTLEQFSGLAGKSLNVRERLEKSMREDMILVEEEVFIKDKFYQVFVAPVKRRGYEILGGIVIFHDITPQKEVERIREDFTSMMVHELRSPVDAMKKISEAILGEKVTPREKELYHRYIELIKDNSSQILGLVNDLLDVAKIEAGKFEVAKSEGDIRAVVSDRISFYKEAAESAGVTLSLCAGSGAPQKLAFDEKRIVQVLNNLISNALKFTPAKGRVVVHVLAHDSTRAVSLEMKTCSIAIEQHEAALSLPGSVVVAVEDSGGGIPRDKIGQLFNKFKQLKNSEGRGTGLGLSIAKGIVEAHGGTIRVFSEEGKGSVFYFTIPLSKDSK